MCCAVLGHSAVSDSLRPVDCSPPDSSVHGDGPGKNTGVGCHALLHGIFPDQGSNLGLLHCRWILYQLSPQGNPSTYSPCQQILGPVRVSFKGKTQGRNWRFKAVELEWLCYFSFCMEDQAGIYSSSSSAAHCLVDHMA